MSPMLPAVIGGGLLSAGLHLSMILGSLGAVILAYLAPLPLFLVGLSLGFAPAAAAGLLGTLAVGIGAGSLLAGGAYALLNALPVALLCRQALLSRAAPGGIEWYPPGLLTMWLSGFGIVAGVLLLFLLGFTAEGLSQTIERSLSAELQAMTQAPGVPPSPSIAAAARMIAPIFPGIAVTSWVVMMMVNASLAQGLLMRFGRNMRPGVRLSSFYLPGWSVYVLAAAGVLSLVASGFPNFLGINAAVVLSVPFFLAGLAVIHAFARTKGNRVLVLAGVYVALLFFGWLALAVIGLGVADQWADFRSRMAPSAPNRES
jgi:Predicted membrane protein (DUF2232)